ncbi:hypothetical protein [Isoalcanivorax indicus]|uniref:hypothetical protein n=1 Tax=Isoalcanivorax indicus TaxID=2202653 RepID=UPI000DB971F2|nr:hypothetical protein [Isoalcanivorax indicus]
MKRLLALWMFSSGAAAGSLQPLDDQDLAEVSAQQGIGLHFEFLINVDMDALGNITPVACPTAAEHSNGTPDCRLALKFNDIDDGWLVLKDYHGALSINALRVDSARTPETPSGYCDAACQARFPADFDPDDVPVLQLSFDHSDIAANTSWYDDLYFYFSVERITAEFGSTGYLDDNITGSALGIRMADGPYGDGGAARMRFDGRMQMYGY